MSATDVRTEAQQHPDQIARDIDSTRARVGETLDELQARLSPGQLLDQAMGMLRGGPGGEFARNLGNQVKDNPLPVALIGAGILWLAASQRSASRRGYDERDDEVYVVESETVTSYGTDPTVGGVHETGAEPMGAVMIEGAASGGDGGPGTMGKVREKMSDVREGVRSRASAARNRASRAGSSLSQGVLSAVGSARAQAGRAQEGLSRMLHEQPLVVGAMGVALGAAIGALLPTTEREDRLLGDLADRTRERAKELGAEGYERARELAQRGAEGARQSLSEGQASGAQSSGPAQASGMHSGQGQPQGAGTGSMPPSSPPAP